MSQFNIIMFFVVFAYLAGSIPFGKLIAKTRNLDIQKEGSGNIGFANSVRVLGWKLGILVLIGDVTKGFIPTYISLNYLTYNLSLVIGMITVLAHIFPVWLKFRGGKGVSTGFGVSLAMEPSVALLGLSTYLIVFIFAKKSAPSSILAGWSLIFYSFIFAPSYIWFSVFLALLGTWTHRENIKKLFNDKKYDEQ